MTDREMIDRRRPERRVRFDAGALASRLLPLDRLSFSSVFLRRQVASFRTFQGPDPFGECNGGFGLFRSPIHWIRDP